MLKSPTMKMESLISPCSSVSVSFIYLEVIVLDTYTF